MSVKGFEKQTHELTEYESEVLLPLVVEGIKAHKGKSNAISNSKLRSTISESCEIEIGDVRFRKIIGHIRRHHLIENLVADNRGYFIAQTPAELQDWLISVKQRRGELSTIIAAGEKSLKIMTGYKQPNQHRAAKINLSAPIQSFII